MEDKVETNVFWTSPAARALLEKFEQDARAAGYDFLLVIVDPKTQVHRTLYHVERDHQLMTQAMDQTYQRILEWYEAQRVK